MRFEEFNVLASICRESFFDFVVEFWHTVIHQKPHFNWHVKLLCDELQAIAERVFKGQPKLYDLIANVPPGSTKSTICSQMFPAWVWTRMPQAQFINVSYAQLLSLKDAISCRDIITSDLYRKCFPNIEMRDDQDTKGLYKNTLGGWRISSSTGGTLTGFHGHFQIVDDPINPEAAFSEADLRTVNRWMETTIPSRCVDQAMTPLILIMQRLHQADPTGEKLEKADPKSIRHICLPAELRADEKGNVNVFPQHLVKHYVNGLLDPVRLGKAVLIAKEKQLGEYGYASQYLQTPVPLGGAMFKVERLVLEEHAPKSMVALYRSWDKAGTKDGGAYTVGVLIGIDRKDEYWILDVVRGQWNAADREEQIKLTATTDGTEIPVLIEIEGGSGGKESGENTVKNLKGHNVICYHPTGDKEARASGFASQVGSGFVHVLKRDWTQDYIQELRFFPHGKYKDQVDASSGGFNKLVKPVQRVGGW